ncbi:MAG TPA: hypothetical protein VIR33_08770 [Thermopolyspora sp.]
MIRRLFYFSLGALAAVWTMRRLRALRPEHIARRALTSAVGAAATVRGFTAEVRRFAGSREIELRARYGLDSVENMGVENRPAPTRVAVGARKTINTGNAANALRPHYHDVKDGR